MIKNVNLMPLRSRSWYRNIVHDAKYKLLKSSLSYKLLIHNKERKSQISLPYLWYYKLVHDLEYEFQIYQNLLVIQTFF
jgi:hypothetical protein